MKQAAQLNITPAQRISRIEAIKGEGKYWDMCRRDDADPSMFGPMVMPFSLPIEMLSESTSTAVWAKWYDGLKNARAAGNLAARKQTAEELAVCGDLRAIDPMQRLTWRLNLDLAAVSADLSGTVTHHSASRMPMLLINQAMASILGSDTLRALYETVAFSRRCELTKQVEQFFPAMKALHENGLFIRSSCQHLLGLAHLLPKLNDQHLSKVEVSLVKLIITCLVRTLPSRLGILIAVSTPAIDDLFSSPCLFSGLSSDDLGTDKSVWTHLPDHVLRETIDGLMDFSFPMYNNAYVDDDNFFDNLINSIDRAAFNLSKGNSVGDTLNQIYQGFLGEFALAEHTDLGQLLTAGGKFFAVQVPNLPEDMVRPGLNMAIDGREQEVVDALFDLAVASYVQSGTNNDLQVLAEYNNGLENAGNRIKELTASGNPKKIARIQKVGDQANQELERGREWFTSLLPGIIALIERWNAFNVKIEGLRRAPSQDD